MVIPETHCNYTYAIPNALEQKIHESFVKTKILLLFPPFNINSHKKQHIVCCLCYHIVCIMKALYKGMHCNRLDYQLEMQPSSPNDGWHACSGFYFGQFLITCMICLYLLHSQFSQQL